MGQYFDASIDAQSINRACLFEGGCSDFLCLDGLRIREGPADLAEETMLISVAHEKRAILPRCPRGGASAIKQKKSMLRTLLEGGQIFSRPLS